MVNSISFPGLFDRVFEINRIAFTVFGKDIMWYGVILTTAVILAAVYGLRRCEEFGWSQDHLMDGLLWCLPAAIIGARAYYVVCEWGYYSQHPKETIAVWKAALASTAALSPR